MGTAGPAVSPAECSLTTLGSFELRIRGQPVPNPSTQKARALLSYLVLQRRRDVPRERLVDVFWHDAEPERARDSLNTALHSIRRALRTADFDPNTYIFANKSIVRWQFDVDVDVERLEHALEADEEPLDPNAVERYRGDFLEGDYDDWTVSVRERFAERYEHLLSRTVRSTKQPTAARKLIARNPYDEHAYAALIDAELAAGRYFSASQIVRQCKAALSEVGAEPSHEFAERFKDIDERSLRESITPQVPFIGRNAELAQLTTNLERHTLDAACIALVEGEPGIGKSSLLDRLSVYATERGRRVICVRAVCDDPRALNVWPATYEALGGKFAEIVSQTKSDAATTLVSALLGILPMDSALVVDDAQYLSGDALETLIAIAKSVAASRSHCVIIATRPEGIAAIADRLAQVQHISIRLRRLSSDEMQTAVALAGVDIDAPAMQLLDSRSRGHPLYLKGLLEQLVHTGALLREGKRWQLTRPQCDLQLPPSLRRLVEARIRARGADATLVATALAIEPSATPDEIAAVAGLPELRVLDAIDDLLGHYILDEQQTGQRQFAFSHDVLEETARTLLPATRRVRLHREFAREMSQSNVRGRAIRQAMHQEAAGMFDEAVSAYVEAAQESADLQAAHATLERAEAGLQCAQRVADSPRLEGLRSRLRQLSSFAHRLLWELDECMRSAEKAVDHARGSNDLRTLADALNVLRSAINVGSMERQRALGVVTELRGIGEKLHDDALIVQSLIDEGMAYRITFAFDRAQPSTQRAFEVASRSRRPELIVKAAIQLLSLATCWWRFEGAPNVIAAVKEVAPRVDWPFRAHLSLVLAMLWIECERLTDAQSELSAVGRILDEATPRPSAHTPFVPRPEIAIRFDYFQAALDSRHRDWNLGLSRFARYAAQYESLLHEPRYRDLFACAQIDLLLGCADPQADDQAHRLLTGLSAAWEPETGFEPAHAPAVTAARVHARKRSDDAPSLLEKALTFLDAEVLRWPFGIDVAYGKVHDAAQALGETLLAERAAGAQAAYASRRLAAIRDLVSV